MTDVATTQPEIRLGRYWTVLVSRWRVVLLGVLTGLLIAGGYLLIAPPNYIATTTVSVFPITSDPYASNRNNSNLLDMTAEATAARSFKVAEGAARSLGDGRTAQDLRENTTATAGADKSTMTITVAADSEAKARLGAAAMAEAYIKMRTDQAQSEIDAGVARDTDRIDSLRSDLSDAIRRLNAAKPGSPAAARASADQQIINLQISALLTRIRSLEGVDTTGGVILNPAALTSIVVKPARKTLLATGLAGGLLLGVVAAFITNSRRRIVHSQHDLSREFEIQTLGVLGDDKSSDDMATVAQRLLRFQTRDEIRVVSIIFDQGVRGYSELTDQLAHSIERAGVSATIVTSLPPDHTVDESSDIILVPIASDSSLAGRLEGLRISDIALLVVGAGATKTRNLSNVLDEASEMGARVVGAVLVSRKRG